MSARVASRLDAGPALSGLPGAVSDAGTADAGTAVDACPGRLRILMVLESSYPAPRGGGAEGQVRTLAMALRARGQRVTVLVPRQRHGPQQRIARIDGIPVCRLAYPQVRLLGGPWLWLMLAAFLCRRRHRYDVWHAHITHHLAAVCAVLGRALKVPVLTKVAGHWELEHGALAPDSGLVNRLAGLGLRQIEVWLAVSRRMASALAAQGIPESRIALVPNAVDTTRFAHLRQRPDVPARFIFIGRMVPVKCLDLLLDAFSDISGAHPAASLRLVGTGPLESGLKAQAQHLGIADRVTFAGHRSGIEAELAAANIGVLCSRLEGLSNTLLESMAAGLPMVASRVSGNEDFVREGENGWLFEPGDRAGLARCLMAAAALTPDARSAMGERARAAVQQQASLERVLAQLMPLYRGERLPSAAPCLSDSAAREE